MKQAAMGWDAREYAQNASAQYGWAQSLIGGVVLSGDEAILDIGCGDGKITAEIAAGQLAPVVGVDSSAAMVELALQSYPCRGNLSFRQMDATQLQFESEFDLVFSNAALHWVADHPAVLQGIARALRPGGRVLLSMGGKGNAPELLPVLDALMASPSWRGCFAGFCFPYTFCGIEEYEGWLPAAGLQATRLELVAKDMVHESINGLKGWLRTTWFPFTGRVAESKREEFLDELVQNYIEQVPVDDLGRTHVKMIRLEVEANKVA